MLYAILAEIRPAYTLGLRLGWVDKQNYQNAHHYQKQTVWGTLPKTCLA